MNASILLVEDDPLMRSTLLDGLSQVGYDVLGAASAAEAERVISDRTVDAAILDNRLPDQAGMEALARFRSIDPDLPIVILTGHGSIELAVAAIQAGVDHFFTKPVQLPILQVVLERLLKAAQARRLQAANAARDRHVADPFVGTSAAMRRLRAEATKVAESDSPLLLQGETGTGKGVLARWLHKNGPRQQEALVELNSAGLSPVLLESELFGHARGAFTGAVATKPGLFESAHRGTLFLDEIGDLSQEIQPELLTAIEDHRFRRLGETQVRVADVRVIAASSRSLSDLTKAGSFLADLYYRLATCVLQIPPLRQRPEDVRPLAEELLSRLATARRPLRFREDALAALESYPWPGNIRELRNVLERSVLIGRGDVVSADHLRFDFIRRPPETEEDDSHLLPLAEVEKRHIERVWRATHGRAAEASVILRVPRSTLYQKLRVLGLKTEG